MEEISSGWNFFSCGRKGDCGIRERKRSQSLQPWALKLSSPSTWTTISGLSLGPATHLKGHSLMSDCTMGSWNLRPIRRLASKTSLRLQLPVEAMPYS